jgi:hypothetical protein
LVLSKWSKIEFEAKDNTIDYGKVNKNDNGSRDFIFTNTGNAPLIISNVLSTCVFAHENAQRRPDNPFVNTH